jgi:3-phosphoshikimate 1-carboxyvinyltransferase
MERVVAPLRELGAAITGTGSPAVMPLEVHGSGPRITGGSVRSAVISAQVKSALLLAGLNAAGPVTVHESVATRDHTERMLKSMGISVTTSQSAGGNTITIQPGRPKAIDMTIPGDMSVAAFMLALGAHNSSQGVAVHRVGLNPGRIGFITVLQRMGANINIKAGGEAAGEPVGTVTVRPSTLVGTEISPVEVASLIDELPVLAALATQCHGETVVRGAGELRVKESDRILAICRGLGALGAQIAPLPDGFVVKGPVQLRGGSAGKPVVVDSLGDHRIAMSLAVAAMWCGEGEHVLIRGAECVGISDPGFFARLEGMRGE